MSIKSRVFTAIVNVATTQTSLTVASFVMPYNGKIKKVSAIAVGTGTTNTVAVYKSATNTVDDSAANSTVLVHDAAITTAAADTVYNDPMTGQYYVPKGVRLYVKGTTYATAYTSLSVNIEVDY